MAFNTETFTPAVDLPSRAVADVEVVDPNLTVQPYYNLGASTARFGGCLVTKDSGTQQGISPATANTNGHVFGMTHVSIQSLTDHRQNPNKYEKDLGNPPGVVQGVGNVWLRRYTGTMLPGDMVVVGASGYPKKSDGTGTVVGMANTSGIGNVGTPTTSILVTLRLPAFGSGIAPVA